MTAAGGVLILVVLLLGLAVPLGLYLLVDRETENTRRMDRTAAEQAVRRDTPDGSRGDGSREDDRWGSDSEWGSDREERTDG
jgi:hypothetical protein